MNFPIFDITTFNINTISLIIDVENKEHYQLYKNILIHKSGNMKKCFIFTKKTFDLKNVNYSIHNNSSYLNEIVETQILEKKKNKIQNILIIIDDITLFNLNNIYFKEILMNNKIFKITCIINISNLTSNIRNNLDYIFIFGKSKLPNVKKIHEYYTNFFHSFDTFKEVYYGLTSESCLVVKKFLETDIIYEKVSIYKI